MDFKPFNVMPETVNTQKASTEITEYLRFREKTYRQCFSPERREFVKKMQKALANVEEVLVEGDSAGLIPSIELYHVKMRLQDIGMIYQDMPKSWKMSKED